MTTRIRPLKFSAEGPWPIYELVEAPFYSPGGAGLAAAYGRNNCILVSSASHNSMSKTGVKEFNITHLAGCDSYSESMAENIHKHRFIGAESGIQIFRIDDDSYIKKPRVDPRYIEETVRRSILKNNVGCVLLMDYCKGFFAPDNIRAIFRAVQSGDNIPVFVDSKDSDVMRKYEGATVFKANNKEMTLIAEKEDVADRLLEGAVVIRTLGKDGASLHRWGQKEYSFSADIQGSGIPNVSGCGDVFSFNFCYYRFIEGLPWEEALQCAVRSAHDYAYMPVDRRLKDGFRTTNEKLRASMPRLSR